MPANLSPLQLEAYYLKELSYSVKDSLETLPALEYEATPVGLEIADVTTLLDEEARKWRCELLIKSANGPDEETPFYDFKIVLIGFFQVNPSVTPEFAKTLAESNSPAVLYSTAREILATVTRRSPYPALLLPLVTFVNLAKPTQPTPKKRARPKKSD